MWILRCLSRRLGRSKCFPQVGHGSALLLLLHSLLGFVTAGGGGEKFWGGGEGLMEGKLSGEKLDHLVGLKWEVGEGREGMEKGAGIADWRLGKVEKGELV